MPEVIANAVPDYIQFGKTTKLRLNPNKVEDLQWTIPGKFATPETQVSEVSASTVQENPPISQDTETQITTGKSDRTIQPGTSCFWSITEKFKKDYIAKSPPSTIVAPYTETNPSKLAHHLVDKQPFQCCKYRCKWLIKSIVFYCIKQANFLLYFLLFSIHSSHIHVH